MPSCATARVCCPPTLISAQQPLGTGNAPPTILNSVHTGADSYSFPVPGGTFKVAELILTPAKTFELISKGVCQSTVTDDKL